MSTPSPTTKGQAFINARPLQVRLVNERATSAPAQPSKEPKKIELRTETGSQFEIGLDNPEAPTLLNVAINFEVRLTVIETEKKLVDYEAKHEVQFSLISWVGFDDWLNVPSDALSPYLGVVHDIALRRAENTLLEMGLRGVGLPRPQTFDGPEIEKQIPAE
ncbi:MAG: hypothetical protein Q8K12_18405 [Thiobacillus sp.]|nr:hypothetical protein [Thiobacillus sp.]